MVKLISKIGPEWALRLGLGAMYVYSGVDIIRHPTSWFWAVRPLLKWLPVSIQASLGAPEVMTKYLVFQGIGELALAFIFLAWFMPRYIIKWAALLSVIEFVGILIVLPIDAITFRDIGLLGAFVALWSILRVESTDFSLTSPSVQEKKVEHKPVREGETQVETFDEFMGNTK